MENKPEITVSVKYTNDDGNNQNNAPKPQKESKPKQIMGICPYCKTHLQTNKGEDRQCPHCGATVTYAEFENQHAVFQATETGKKKLNFSNLIKKWWFWVSIALIVALIIGLATPNDTTIYEKNQTVSVSNCAITIIDVTETKTIKAISQKTTTNNYLIVLVKLTNNQQSAKVFSSGDFKVYYNGHTYEQKSEESYWYGYNNGRYEGFNYLQTVDSGLSETFYLVFEVPETLDRAQYLLSFKPGTKEVKIKLY